MESNAEIECINKITLSFMLFLYNFYMSISTSCFKLLYLAQHAWMVLQLRTDGTWMLEKLCHCHRPFLHVPLWIVNSC